GEVASRLGAGELERRALAAPAPPPLCLAPQGFDLLAEVKFVSPAAGALAPSASAADAVQRARLYARGGAAALSVLTQPSPFAGDGAHLSAVARALPLPVLRKDFLVDPLQVHEARLAGASGVLLVLRMLDDSVLEGMLAAARAGGLFVLLEAFDADDLERAHAVVERAAGVQLLVGVNARDLRTLAAVPGRTHGVRPPRAGSRAGPRGASRARLPRAPRPRPATALRWSGAR